MAQEIEVNQHYAGLLGWTPAHFGAAGFDDGLVAAIRAKQGTLGVEADGLCGPQTFAALVAGWLKDEQAKLVAAGSDKLAVGGRIALQEARLLWLRTVVDPPTKSSDYAASRDVIDQLIRSENGLGWTWEDPYRKNGDFEWCGSVPAWGWRSAHLLLPLRKTYFASTYRLDRYARYVKAFDNQPNPAPADRPRLMVELDESSGPMDARFAPDVPPRAGDILMVGGKQTGYGKHICLVESYDLTTGVFTTIEGNGTGLSPRGARMHGIVRGKRQVGLKGGDAPTHYHARRLIRPSIHDLDFPVGAPGVGLPRRDG